MNISTKYHIPARQIDFVNINLTKDNKLFIDPYRIKAGKDKFSKRCYTRIEDFLNLLVELVKKKKYQTVLEIIDHFYERNETRLGYSLDTVYGKSFGGNSGTELIRLLSKDNLLESGFIEDIFDFLMLIPNIGEDKVSDFITTIIFLDLVEYTSEQCELWKIPTAEIVLKKFCWNADLNMWIKQEAELPVYNGKPIVFVPKSFVGKDYIFSYDKLYRDVIIPLYKQLEDVNIESKFVVTYKNGRKHVLGNELRKEYPCTKYVILDFIRKYDALYREYKAKKLI